MEIRHIPWMHKFIITLSLWVLCLSNVSAEQINWPVSRTLDSGKFTVEKSEVVGLEGDNLTYRSPVQLQPKDGSDAVSGELLSFWQVEFEDDGKTPKLAYIEAIEVHFPQGYRKQANELMQAVIDNLPVTTLNLRQDIETAHDRESAENPGSKRSGYNTEPTEYKYDYDRQESIKQAEKNNQLKGKGGLLITPGGKGRGFWN